MIRTAARSLLAILFAALLSGGCVNIEYGISVEEDLSGTMELAVGLNPDQMAYGMATMQRSFQGGEGPPTEEEVAAARERIMADIESQREEFDVEEIRAEAREDLPEGVEVVDVQQSEDGLSTRIVLRFDHLRLLDEVSLSPSPDSGAARSRTEMKPLAGFTVEDEGDTYLLTNTPIDPVAQADSQPSPMQGMGEQLVAMMQAREGGTSKPLVTFWLELPGEVVEHTATRVEGPRLYWEYGLESFGRGDTARSIRARFRKP